MTLDVASRAALVRGFAAMGAEPDEVHVAEDLAAAVNAEEDTVGYDVERGTGVVAGRTSEIDGKIRITLNGPLIQDLEMELVERLAAHEAGHVLLRRRQETFEGHHDIFERTCDWWLGAIQGSAMEEYRIELALAQLGYGPTDSTEPASLLDSVRCAESAVVQLLLSEAGQNTALLQDGVMRQLELLTTLLAYTSAYAIQAKNDPRQEFPLGLERDIWNDLIGVVWERTTSLYMFLPTVRTPLSTENWRKLIFAGSKLGHQFLDQVGFTIGEHEGNSYFIRQASDDFMRLRLNRLVALDAHSAD